MKEFFYFCRRCLLEMRKFTVISALLLCSTISFAQGLTKSETRPRAVQVSTVPAGNDVFTSIGRYLAAGDAESLSAWFAPNLEVAVLGNPSDCSKNQAIQIMKSFFKSYVPRSFRIVHQAGRANQRYALGDLNASGEIFRVTIFASSEEGGSFKIQQLKVDRLD